MNFLLSSEQREMQESIARFLADRCPSTTLHKIFDGEPADSLELWRGLCELGVGGIALPEAHGGLGLELIDLAIVAETLGRAAAPGPFLGHSLAALAILLAGSDGQKSRWLPKLASGELLGSVAFGEGESCWQPEDWQMPASDSLNGSKRFVLFGASADLIVVGLAGGRLAVVEKNAEGLAISAEEGVDRTRRCDRLAFENVPAELLTGSGDPATRLRDAALVLLAADAFGGASRCLEMAVEYAKLREQFGVPIGQFQALKHQLANMAVEVEPARGLYWYAAHAWDHIPEQSARSAALAKAHLGERYMQAARDTVEAHGGIGYTWEYDVQIYFKRAMFDYAWLGAPPAHRARAADLAGW